MSNLVNQAAPAVSQLLESDEDQLYAEIGLRMQAMSTNAEHAGTFESTARFSVEFQGAGLDALKDFGQRFYNKVSHQVYDLVCGGGTGNEKDRQSLLGALTDKSNFAAVLAALLVSQLAMAPAIAAVVAAITVKVFFKPGYDAMCETWKNRLPAA